MPGTHKIQCAFAPETLDRIKFRVTLKELRSLILFAFSILTLDLDVLDFGGLFSGNAIGPPHSAFLRVSTTF